MLYSLHISYTGGNPVPSYLYINGEKISENIGYLATLGEKRGEFVFPIVLAKGTNELRLEHPGRRSNKIYAVNGRTNNINNSNKFFFVFMVSIYKLTI